MSGRYLPAVLVGLAVGACLVGGLLVPGRHFAVFSGDIGVKFMQMDALVGGAAWLDYAGADIDPERLFFPFRPPFVFEFEERIYSVYLNPVVVLGTWLYRAGGVAVCWWLALLSVAGVVIVTARLASRLGAAPLVAAATGILVLAATPMWFYGWVFWEHAPATLLCVSATLLALPPATRWRRVVAGCLCGLATACRPEAGLFAVALASSSAVVRRRASDFIVVGAAALVTFAAVSVLMPGPAPLNRLTAHLAQVSASFSHDGGSVELLEWRGHVARQLLANTAGPLPKNFRGWLHLTTALGGVLLLCTGGLRRWLPAGGIARTSLMLVVLVLSTVPAVLSIHEPRLLLTGLLSASPLLVAALPAMVSSSVRGADRDGDLRLGERFIAIQCLLFLLLVLVSAANDGGNQCGPRYFLPAVPLAVWLAVSELGFGPRRSRLTRVRLGLAAAFVAAGILVQGIGADNFFAMQGERARVFKRLAALPGSDVLTSAWFVPQAGAPMALTEGKRFFFTPSSRELGLAVQGLRNADITSFGYVEIDRRGVTEMRWGNYWGRSLGTYYVQPFRLRLWDFRLVDSGAPGHRLGRPAGSDRDTSDDER